MPKKLTKLKIHEVSAVDSGAGRGVRIMLAKRKPQYEFTDAAGSLVRVGKLVGVRTERPDVDSLAKALKEIELNKRTADHAAAMEDNMDVITTMSARLAEVRKADPTIRSDNHALLKLSESRNPSDLELFRNYKNGVAPAGAVAKEFDAGKAIKKMAKRCDELMSRDPSVRSRESAIAKVAMSRDPEDLKLWTRYKAAGQGADVAQLRSQPAPVGKARDEVEFERLCRALAEMYPGYAEDKVRQWARQIVESSSAAAGDANNLYRAAKSVIEIRAGPW